jgi:asparagine synthase (glutamine-hydrolysing)
MCGICGKVDFSGRVVEPKLIETMCGALVHRGPDGEGIHTAPHIGLGQRRLAIIDLDPRAVAPLSNEDASVWVTFNGEIYNFKELRSRLIARGHTFKTETDTEVIVHLYEEHGFDCVRHLRGMFAFAVWDGKKKILFAARDRLGKKPFYYARTSSSFVFASEIKAITENPEIGVSPNYGAIDQFLTYSYTPSPATAFEGIHKLPPAHTLICSSDGSLLIDRFWSPPNQQRAALRDGDLRAELTRELNEAVAVRLNSDVPLGVFLSGGVDSASVVALMAQQSGKAIKTFSIGFEEPEYNELPQARLVAEMYGTDHHELVVRPIDADFITKLVHFYNEPFADSSAVPTFYLSEFARKYVTVALSGDGGDELFSGYSRYGQLRHWATVDVVPRAVRSTLSSSVRSVLEVLPYSNTTARYSRGLYMFGGDLPHRYDLIMSVIKPEEKRQLYTESFRSHLRSDYPFALRLTNFEWDASMDDYDWMMRNDQSFYLPDCLMTKVDVASMAHGLEVRCPLVDHKLTEFVATIPSNMKRRADKGKLIFKDTLGQLLPKGTLQKPKTGFGLPVSAWLRRELRDLLTSILLDDVAARRGLLNVHFVRRMVDEHIAGKRDWGYRLWTLLMLEMWFRQFID